MGFSYENLSPAAMIAVSGQISEAVKDLITESDPRFSELYIRVENDTDTLKTSMHKSRKGERTEDIELSHNRVKHYLGIFRDSTKLAARDNEISERGRVLTNPASTAALKVLEVMKWETPLSQLSRSELIGALTTIGEVYETPELQQVLTDAGVLDKYIRLYASLAKLIALLNESAELESKKNQILCPSSAKSTLSKSLKRLCKFIEIFAEIDNADFISAADRIDEVLQKFRPLLNHHDHQEEESSECEEPHCSDHETEEGDEE